MVMLDANMVLRYLVNDNQEMADAAEKIIMAGNVCVTNEVMAEVVYVLKGVYSVERGEIAATLLNFLKEIDVCDRDVLSLALRTYGEKNLDFVDCILYAYHKVKNCEICTFDQKLRRLLNYT